MKKILSMLLVLSMLLGCAVAVAETGVQLISGPEMESEPVSLDDFKLNTDAEIDGFGILCGTESSIVDTIYYNPGSWIHEYKSGAEAEYAVLRIDILNTTKKTKDYLSSCEVKVVYDEEYEYGGWFRQYDYNRSDTVVLAPEEQFGIEPMYQGHYAFICTLPNAVVNSKKPLRMEITIDGNEIIYNIRK